jgi:hypothetical protein
MSSFGTGLPKVDTRVKFWKSKDKRKYQRPITPSKSIFKTA